MLSLTVITHTSSNKNDKCLIHPWMNSADCETGIKWMNHLSKEEKGERPPSSSTQTFIHPSIHPSYCIHYPSLSPWMEARADAGGGPAGPGVCSVPFPSIPFPFPSFPLLPSARVLFAAKRGPPSLLPTAFIISPSLGLPVAHFRCGNDAE